MYFTLSKQGKKKHDPMFLHKARVKSSMESKQDFTRNEEREKKKLKVKTLLMFP